jgi:hypothetical protein
MVEYETCHANPQHHRQWVLSYTEPNVRHSRQTNEQRLVQLIQILKQLPPPVPLSEIVAVPATPVAVRRQHVKACATRLKAWTSVGKVDTASAD